MKINIEEKDFDTLCICAIRYCHGRMSYMPGLVQDIIKQHLSEISDIGLNVMIDDCRFQKSCQLYGDLLIDKPGWLKYEEVLKEEKERRKKKEREC